MIRSDPSSHRADSTTPPQSPREQRRLDFEEDIREVQKVATRLFFEAAPLQSPPPAASQSPHKRSKRDFREAPDRLAKKLFFGAAATESKPPAISYASATAFRRHSHAEETFHYSPKVGNTPYLPRGRSKNRSAIKDPFNQQAIANEDAGSFQWGDRTIPFGHTLVGGAHCLIVKIPEGQPPLIPGIDNRGIIYKSFLKRSIMTPSDEAIYVSDGSADRVLAQYQQLKDAGVSVAQLFKKEPGYFIFEFIPHAFQPTWSEDATTDNNEDFKAVYQLFHIAAHKQIDADIRPANLGRREDGTIAVLDFLESAPKKGADLWFELENRIRTFCQKGDAIYNQLLQAIASLKPSYI